MYVEANPCVLMFHGVTVLLAIPIDGFITYMYYCHTGDKHAWMWLYNLSECRTTSVISDRWQNPIALRNPFLRDLPGTYGLWFLSTPNKICLDRLSTYNQLVGVKYVTKVHDSRKVLYIECKVGLLVIKKKGKLSVLNTWIKLDRIPNILSVPMLDKARY